MYDRRPINVSNPGRDHIGGGGPDELKNILPFYGEDQKIRNEKLKRFQGSKIDHEDEIAPKDVFGNRISVY